MVDDGETPVCLVGDIGGTSARFALASLSGARPRLIEGEIYQCANFPSAEAAALAYLSSRTTAVRPSSAVLAVAGPVIDGAIAFTNMDWVISEDAFSRALQLQSTKLMNDYAALALAAPLLEPSETVAIGPVNLPRLRETVAVVGAGTGFGVSALVRDGAVEAILSTEGGHVAFAPGDAVEMEVLRILSGRFGRVSVERILSGPGLINLHLALCEIDGRESRCQSPTEITDQAAEGDPEATATVERFCAILGAVAGDFALAYGARGGVFIAGGVAGRMTSTLLTGAFRERFESKGRFTNYLSGIPTCQIRQPHTAAQIGAACARPNALTGSGHR